MAQNIIEIKELSKDYGNGPVVDNLNLSIGKGEVFGLLGPNGAGKSTTIRMLLGLTEPTSGRVEVDGISSSRQPVEVKRMVGYLPEEVGFYSHLSGVENLMYTARLNGLSGKDASQKVDELIEWVGLKEHANKKIGAYSRGMKQRLGLADVLIKNPRVIILDEPTLGLDPEGVKSLLGQIVELSRTDGITVLFSSHHLYQVQQVCDRIGLFVKGKLIANGDIASLSEQLFSDQVRVQAGISLGASNQNEGWEKLLADRIKQLQGVSSVDFNQQELVVQAPTNVSSSIAKVVVEMGLSLDYLKSKEFGIDDIYHRYFSTTAKV